MKTPTKSERSRRVPKGLLRSLEGSADPNVRRGAARALGKHPSPRAAEALCAALSDPDRGVRCCAALSLAQAPTREATRPLVQALAKAGDSGLRAEILAALAACKDRRAVPAALRWLRSTPRGTEAFWAIKVLAAAGGRRAVDGLVAYLGAPGGYQSVAAEALGEIGDRRALGPVLDHAQPVSWSRAVQAAARLGTARSLATALSRRKACARRCAAAALASRGERGAVRALTAALTREKNPAVRGELAAALSKLGQPVQGPGSTPVLAAVAAGDWAAIAQLGTAAVAPLGEALAHPDPLVRSKVVGLLGSLGDERAAPALVALLRRSDAPGRAGIARALGQLRARSAVPALVAAVEKSLAKGEVTNLDAQPVWALGAIGDAAAVPVLSRTLALAAPRGSWIEHLRQQAAEALGAIGGPGAAAPLLAALEDPDAGLRRAAAQALERLDLAPRDLRERVLRLAALRRWEDLAALGPVVAGPLVAVFAGEPDQALKRGLATVLGRLGDPRTAEPVLRWLFGSGLEAPSEPVSAKWAQALTPLFGDFAPLVVDASSWTGCSEHDVSSSRTEFHYDLGRGDDAVRALAASRQAVASNLLHLVAAKRPIEVLDMTVDPYGGGTRLLAFDEQRRLAAQALEERGAPPYDAAAYLAPRAWVRRRSR